MKRILLILNFLLIVTILNGNPIALPSVTISELTFDSTGEWIIGLFYFDTNSYKPIDSIWIKSSSGAAKLKRFNIIGSSGILVVRNDSLLSKLNIDPFQDTLQILYYLDSYEWTSIALVYGKLPDTKLIAPGYSQSLAGVPPSFNFTGLYSLDKSPTIGTVNDTIGMCGTIKGHIYDKNGHLLYLKSGWFYNTETDINFYPYQDGSYSTRLYSKQNHNRKMQKQ